MAGNMQQMPPGGQFLAQQQHRLGMGQGQGPNNTMALHIYNALQSAGPVPPGWQSNVSLTERMKNIQVL